MLKNISLSPDLPGEITSKVWKIRIYIFSMKASAKIVLNRFIDCVLTQPYTPPNGYTQLTKSLVTATYIRNAL
jgi:hypothetical protein